MRRKQKSWAEHKPLKRVSALIEVEKAQKLKVILANHNKSLQSWIDDLVGKQVVSPGELISNDSTK